MPLNESIECYMTISVNHLTINNSKPMVNHANIYTLLLQNISDKHIEQ